METQYLEINENQWLSDTELFRDGIPNGYIIYKKLPNIGATHSFLKDKRYNGIMLEFNTPVLEGKRNALNDNGIGLMHPGILCVYEDKTTEDVVDYLNSDIKPKKILATPQGYMDKVKPAIEASAYSLYDDFTMVIDECDKLSSEVDYRIDIIKPMDDFFKFKSRAMISATATEPSDPRFLEHGFKNLKIQPTWNYKQSINLVNTNNVVFAVVKKLKVHTENKVFIFLNSTDLIYDIIKLVGIEDHSRVYCAETSVTKLRREYGFRRAQSSLNNFAKFNFLTSRCFSAVDIKLRNEKPDIIMVTHVYRSPYTMLNPYTDAVQIHGRLRNGISSFTHISNFKHDIESKAPEDARNYITENARGFKAIKAAKEVFSAMECNSDTTVFDEALNSSFKKYTAESGELNYFMLDNYILDEQTKSYYKDVSSLTNGYTETDYFIPHVEEPMNFTQTDVEILGSARKLSKRTTIEIVVTGLSKIDNPPNGEVVFFFDNNPYNYRTSHPKICAMYDELKYDKIKSLGFEEHKILAEIGKRRKAKTENNPEFARAVQSLYKVGDEPLKSHFIDELSKLYQSYNITKKLKHATIQDFYDAKESMRSVDGVKVKIWIIEGIKNIQK